jgi:hypothetical protein
MELIKHNSKLWERKGDSSSYCLFWCPACKCGHTFKIPQWNFDGNISSPTFTPSLRLFITRPETNIQETICHLNITNGQIIYHGDCPHELKGKTIPMVDLSPNYGF